MTNVQNPYAHDENGNLVFIENAQNKKPYFCPGCGARMVARLGTLKAHGFAHYRNQSCNGETYLHQTAKEIIIKRFNSGYFPVIMNVPTECSEKCDLYDSVNCSSVDSIEYNLSQYYDLPPQIEKSLYIDGERFQPDVAFYSTNPKRKPICIEIFHTSACSEKKLALCKNVIEIPILCFQDLVDLENKTIASSKDKTGNLLHAEFINFDFRHPVPVSRERFLQWHPRCTWTEKEKHDDALFLSSWWKLYWYKSGKKHLEKILEEEKYIHKKSSAFEVTVERYSLDIDVMFYLISKVYDRFPELRLCTGCKYYRKNEFCTEWCCKAKNGSSRKGTYDATKAATCNEYLRRYDSAEPVELWMQGDPDNKIELI